MYVQNQKHKKLHQKPKTSRTTINAKNLDSKPSLTSMLDKHLASPVPLSTDVLVEIVAIWKIFFYYKHISSLDWSGAVGSSCFNYYLGGAFLETSLYLIFRWRCVGDDVVLWKLYLVGDGFLFMKPCMQIKRITNNVLPGKCGDVFSRSAHEQLRLSSHF
jgi:hypothetical protein